jgi:hypothetical protein
MSAAEKIARAFHDEYEAFAAMHGWETQETTRTSFDDLPDENRRTMLATVQALLDRKILAASPHPAPSSQPVAGSLLAVAAAAFESEVGTPDGYEWPCGPTDEALRPAIEAAAPSIEAPLRERLAEVEAALQFAKDRIRDLEDQRERASEEGCDECEDRREAAVRDLAAFEEALTSDEAIEAVCRAEQPLWSQVSDRARKLRCAAANRMVSALLAAAYNQIKEESNGD